MAQGANKSFSEVSGELFCLATSSRKAGHKEEVTKRLNIERSLICMSELTPRRWPNSAGVVAARPLQRSVRPERRASWSPDVLASACARKDGRERRIQIPPLFVRGCEQDNVLGDSVEPGGCCWRQA